MSKNSTASGCLLCTCCFPCAIIAGPIHGGIGSADVIVDKVQTQLRITRFCCCPCNVAAIWLGCVPGCVGGRINGPYSCFHYGATQDSRATLPNIFKFGRALWTAVVTCGLFQIPIK